METQIVLYSLLVFYDNERVETASKRVFTARLSPDTPIPELAKIIKGECKPDLDHLATYNLELWKCKTPLDDPRLADFLGHEALQGIPRAQIVPAGTEHNVGEVSMERLGDLQPTSHYWNAESRPPSINIVVLARALKNLIDEDEYNTRKVEGNLAKQYEDIVINVAKWGRFQHQDILLNNLISTTPAADRLPFVSRFEATLVKKVGMAADAENLFSEIEDRECRSVYFAPTSTTSGDEASAEDMRAAGKGEVSHILHVSLPWERFWNPARAAFSGIDRLKLKESLFSAMCLWLLPCHLPVSDSVTLKFGMSSWPFELMTRKADDASKELRSYRPKSDFLLSKSQLPRLMIEVNSTSSNDLWPADLIRMLLSGAAIVRFANGFLDAFKQERDFVLITIYIRENGAVDWYTLFQIRNESRVHYSLEKLTLDTAPGRAGFMLRLYNLVHMLCKTDEDTDTKTTISKLVEAFVNYRAEYGMKSFHTESNSAGSKRKRVRSDHGAPGGVRGSGEQENDVDADELAAHDYQVVPDVIEFAPGHVMETLRKLPPNILTVFRKSNHTKTLVAKKIPAESTEIDILTFIGSKQTRSEHIISMLDSFRGESCSWAIFPKLPYSLRDALALSPDELSRHVRQVCFGLIKGLAFLHELRVAHRDIKPANLLVDGNFCLKIIDFDLAVRVRNEDDEVGDQCGTKGWTAPEVEKLTYSPIRSDRWSCGHTIQHVLNRLQQEDALLKDIALKLKADDPQQRPSLTQCREWNTMTAQNARSDKAPEMAKRPLSSDEETLVDFQPEIQNPAKRCKKLERISGGGGGDLVESPLLHSDAVAEVY
ncbi:hypothetical protein HGRIS_001024 [Hohenbuehelia grisea]|uniref:Protein kinase domain-containing protein n=1 Tax=Hohenbuehelia grisea TaxID=104357 RepID=A0ABR3JN95_9AGAR